MSHVRGDPHCRECCCRPASKCECGGLMHMTVVDEVYGDDVDPDYWGWVHDYKCDQCGKEENGTSEPNAIEFESVNEEK